MAERFRIDLEQIGREVLCYLHYVVGRSDARHISPDEIAKQLKKATPRTVELAAEEMSRDSILIIRNPTGGLSISTFGVQVVEGWSNAEYERAEAGVIFPDLDNSETGQNLPNASVAERSDDIWEPLPVDRSAEEYQEAVGALEDAIDKIEGDNGYADTYPEERNSIIFSMRQGLEQVKNYAMSLPQVQALIIGPLNKAIERFKDAAPGIAAFAAKEAFKRLLASLF